jgi:hypothetical protein
MGANIRAMDPDRMLTLTDAATLAGCSRKALERRVERGSLVATRDTDGQRRVRAADLLRAGLVTLAPACVETGAAPERMAEAESEAEALRTALVATEAALRRARDEMRTVKATLLEAETRATLAEQDLTQVLVGETPVRESGRRGRLRLRTA